MSKQIVLSLALSAGLAMQLASAPVFAEDLANQASAQQNMTLADAAAATSADQKPAMSADMDKAKTDVVKSKKDKKKAKKKSAMKADTKGTDSNSAKD